MKKILLTIACLAMSVATLVAAKPSKSESVYKSRPNDPEAIYFTPENYPITADGKTDVSDALQQAVNDVKSRYNFGVLFVPEGTYKISKTIYMPPAVRLIGYGENRPTFVLAKNSPGFQEEVAGDKGRSKYMFWFTGNMVAEGQTPRDASAGTFYSAMSNVDVKIEDGNPWAIAFRTHFAQHSFISNVDIHIGSARAGLFDVGNAMENVRFFGGQYGIYTTKTSPGWQMMVVNTYFEGQSKAAIFSQEGGMAIINLTAKNVPTVVEIQENYSDKLYMEECTFENVSGPAIIVSNETNSTNQISLFNVVCNKVPTLSLYRRSGTVINGAESKIYRVNEFTHGLQMESLEADSEVKTVVDLEPLQKMPAPFKNYIPRLPEVSEWVNIKDLGAKGDGVTDDTAVIQKAVKEHKTIYFPAGWYVISETIKMEEGTTMIGLSPIATQLVLLESTPAFSGFGAPKAMLESSTGRNVFTGIGLNTNAYNYRAVACKWVANADSYMNDVKFIGGHGTMGRTGSARESQLNLRTSAGPARGGWDNAWDNQYWSLWVTDNGGGTFMNIWTANTFASSGLYVQNTSTPSRIFAMSLEHHVRSEGRSKNGKNWKMYCMQTEEESVESIACQPFEFDNCEDILMANTYMFRVIRIETPWPQSITTYNCKNLVFYNLHNYAQTQYTATIPLYDVNTGREIRDWEMNKAVITGEESTAHALTCSGGYQGGQRIVSGYEFLQGAVADSKGNVYFCDFHQRRVYKWDAETELVEVVNDFQWKPLSLAVDTDDNLLVIFKYTPQPGYMVNGEQERAERYPDTSGTSIASYLSGFVMRVYSIDPENPEATIKECPAVPMGSIKNVAKAYYPANRWRDFHDFNTVSVRVPEKCFVAPDGKTIIPNCYDFIRSASALPATPGKTFYLNDEYDRRVVKYDVDNEGKLSGLEYFVEKGDFGNTVGPDGNIYVTDGHLMIFSPEREHLRTIKLPEPATSLVFGGKDGKELFMTSHTGLYRISLD